MMDNDAIAAIERRAARVLAEVPDWLWNGESLPVPLEEIADTCFQLLVRDVDDLTAAPGAPALVDGQSLSGLLLASRGEIWVNASEAREWPPRRRFTIGHELGHWVMHRTGQQTLFCRTPTVDPPESRLPLPLPEEEANYFAAALLMPAPLVRAHYDACGADSDHLRNLFNVSGAALQRRLHRTVPGSR